MQLARGWKIWNRINSIHYFCLQNIKIYIVGVWLCICFTSFVYWKYITSEQEHKIKLNIIFPYSSLYNICFRVWPAWEVLLYFYIVSRIRALVFFKIISTLVFGMLTPVLYIYIFILYNIVRKLSICSY